jgi:hypothetical protein
MASPVANKMANSFSGSYLSALKLTTMTEWFAIKINDKATSGVSPPFVAAFPKYVESFCCEDRPGPLFLYSAPGWRCPAPFGPGPGHLH